MPVGQSTVTGPLFVDPKILVGSHLTGVLWDTGKLVHVALLEVGIPAHLVLTTPGHQPRHRLGTMHRDFWNTFYSGRDPTLLSADSFMVTSGPTDRAFLELIGDVEGKSVLELGSDGALTLHLASKGARVLAIDTSRVAVDNLTHVTEKFNLVSQIHAIEMDARQIDELKETFDLIVGKFILHHIEPFGDFIAKMYAVTSQGARGVFIENNANSNILMWFRNHIVGRFGVPKLGDSEESPFDRSELEMLKRQFDEVNVYSAEFEFFRMLGLYVFKDNEIFKRIDSVIYKHCPPARRFGYRQVLEVIKR